MTAGAPELPRGSLESAGRELCERHEACDRPTRTFPVWAELDAVPAWLERALRACDDPEPATAKAAEWLLDNDYLVQRAVLQIRQDLPPGFLRRLATLAGGDGAGLPRSFALGHGLLRASRLQLSLPAAVRFIDAYQDGGALTIAELWAFPTMLRLACLELLVTAFGRLVPELDAPFAPTPLVRESDAFEDTECVARALANLGVIAAIPWKEFFVRTSRVEATLCGDPASVYARMDFETCDRYRREVENLASGADRSELDVAERAVARARASDAAASRAHVGHWLVGEGRGELERSLGYRPGLRAACGRWLLDRAAPLYGLALAAATAGAAALPAAYLLASGAGPLLWAFGTAVALLPASVVGATLVHWVTARVVPPRILPKLDFGKAIPPESRAAVVMPVLVAGPEQVPLLLDRLELHYLANPDPTLQFALLTDPVDAPTEHVPRDEDVLQALVEGIRELNARHGGRGHGRFHVLHRPRRHNPAEGCWMAWERKRGKLEQFNDLVVEGDLSGFSVHEGDLGALRRIRFVVTADADTQLPPGSVARLVGTLAHPLNQARFDPDTGRVKSGYTVVQPRVEISPEAGSRSLFARLYAGDTAIDIYTRAVSDVYQDLFGVGIYVGKGVYDVQAFRTSLEGRVPENALASHDLFEGIHGRAALATDIVLYEEFPASYEEFARRWHRWLRGDWALVPWLAGRVSGRGGERLPGRLSWLARWMILDNLRRALLPPSLVALLVAGWLVLPGSPWVWTGLAVAAPGAHLISDLVTGFAWASGRRRGVVRTTRRILADHAGRWIMAIVFLAQDSATALDAMVRTMWRLAVSRRHLLEWISAAHTTLRVAERGTSSITVWRRMWASPALALGLGTAISLFAPAAWPSAAPLLLLWLAAPEIAARIGRPRAAPREQLGPEERVFLRRIARRTWLFFETFVGPDDHWLPPDNFQEEPRGELASRTSPTNVGMLLLSSLTACDLGYLGPPDLAARVRNTLDTLERLPQYRGHLLNWYDTRSLEPLEPRYVSTVDSGNLAVSLLALEEGCREIAAGPVMRAVAWDGLSDGLDLLRSALEGLPEVGVAEIRARIASIGEHLSQARRDPGGWHRAVQRLCERDCPELDGLLVDALALPRGSDPETLQEVHVWLERVHHHLRSMQRDIGSLLPWLPLVDAPAAGHEALATEIAGLLPPTVAIDQTPALCARARKRLAEARGAKGGDSAAAGWLEELDAALDAGTRNAGDLHAALLDAAARAEAMAWAMDFGLLYDADLRLFYIGYNASRDQIDPHHYDLLATEARLASFFAIVKGDVPVEHWFFLGRPLAEAHGGITLVSWGGSMFEYLMPPLVLRSHPQTLLGRSERMAVEAQRRYAKQLGIPWGMSESGFASLSPERHYRYRAFGVPGLGLRRGLARDLVVAPYASALALAALPETAVENLQALERLGAIGCYGFFEALDFTPERVPEGRRFRLVRSYMAHHQGMILAALGNALTSNALVRRFHAEKRVRAIELLLDERVPQEIPAQVVRADEHGGPAPRRHPAPAPAPWVPTTRGTFPQVLALGNGRLSSWISESGAGALRWHDQALTRWLPDATRDDHGLWIYVRDEESGATWSAARQPTGAEPSEERLVFHSHLAEFHRRDDGIAIGMEVGVAPGDDVEIRRLTVVNESERPRSLLLSSYGEVVLSTPLEDERHPAFSKLFVHSEHLPALDALLFTRRPRNAGERFPLLLHRLVTDDPDLRAVGFDADRRSFLGRDGTERLPRGIAARPGGAAGWTLDAAFALQVRLELAPQERRRLAFVTLVAGSRESLLDLADRHDTLSSLDWALGDAAAESSRELQRLGLDPSRLPAIQQLTSLVVQPHRALRAAPAILADNRLGQSRLWGLALSGDVPIVLLRAGPSDESDLLQLLVKAQQLWRRRGIHADLVVLRSGASGYAEPLRERLFEILRESGADEQIGRPGGVHLLFGDQTIEEERRLVEAVACVVLDDAAGPLERQLAGIPSGPAEAPRFEATARPEPDPPTPPLPRPAGLRFDNGIGGFSDDGREYVIHLDAGESTPAPWSNVLANDGFGSVVTESGGGFTWAGNSGENRLTPWACDPVADPPSEALYLRDEETTEIWTPTPRPAGDAAACQIRHGAGYTEWHTQGRGLAQVMRVFVPPGDPVKIVRLELRNLWQRPRRITATYYAEWLLGALRSTARSHVVCEYEPDLRALLARNPWNPDFADRLAFLASNLAPHGVTADRQEFLGREGDPRHPAGLLRWGLSGRVDPRADPCGALQVHLNIAPEGTAEVVFVLGQGRDRDHVDALVRRWREPVQVDRGWQELERLWDDRLGAVQVKTDDPAFDLMTNRWLLYQTLASRILARAGCYQAGGAIGFRDQLQDHLALLHADPARTRAHILACAEHQFEEGDVLHWWHPPSGRGVRTRCSDDLLWLPYAVAHYVEATGDASILDEDVSFLRAPPLAPDEEDRYAAFEVSPERRSLFEHCERALERGATRGNHGLPLIGSGDWNDGMDRVGRRGRGESVWLAWFTIATLRGFAALCRRRGENELAARWNERRDALEQALEGPAWDGAWYVRAFDDDGRPWGAAACDECRIDSISQSWSVLSGARPTDRTREAMESAERELVRRDERLVRLLWPPFAATPRDPGYIKAYPPGIRENGGQYTHAAAWLGWAFAEQGDGDRAAAIFDLLNPIRQAASREDAERYRVEPYVLAADVASVPPHVGRGGWTWYTGAAAWTWRLAVEAILGLRLRDGRLLIEPRLPAGWGGFEARIRGPAGTLEIRVENPDGKGSGVVEVRTDERPCEGAIVEFPSDGSVRRVDVRLGSEPARTGRDTLDPGSAT